MTDDILEDIVNFIFKRSKTLTNVYISNNMLSEQAKGEIKEFCNKLNIKVCI